MPVLGEGERVTRIAPRSGAAFMLGKGARLSVIDSEGEQVSDLIAFNAEDRREYLSSGRSLDYAGRLYLTKGDVLYSNRSIPMLKIIEDDVGRHDFTLTPCSRDTFRILYDNHDDVPGCQGNLEQALKPFGILPDAIPVTFNIFMNVVMEGEAGQIKVLPPLSRAGQRIVFEAQMDLIIGLTACSAGQSNNFRFKPIDYEIISQV